MIPVCLALKHFHVLLAVRAVPSPMRRSGSALGGLRHTQLWRRVLGPLADRASSFVIEPWQHDITDQSRHGGRP